MNYKDLIIPKLNVNDNKVTIENLRFKNLDFIAAGETIYTVSTSKSVEDYEVDFSGYIVFYVEDGDDVEIGKSAGIIYKERHDAERKLSEIKEKVVLAFPNVSKKALEYAREINFDLSLIKKDGIVKIQDIEEYIQMH